MTVTDDYLANNADYASGFEGPLPMPPSKHIAILACMDARLDVYRLLGINEGEAHVIRNAGAWPPTTPFAHWRSVSGYWGPEKSC
ncbi:carbonic anhydrase family protein [Mycobacterium ulcerans str. Harvey]|uniref:carbonic anhydrase n=1 Tax=Mycobacterium ulcerans str. Harvey TaxID=1299332 RepID=A0ABP3A6V4_MYCUL|nr:carbonic anhydrase family protein [Mycobacterium ulcerans str. Harvey]